MGIWDSVKNRLRIGGGNETDGRGYYGYDEGDYEDGDYNEDYDSDYDDDEPVAMRSFGVDRADYYSDSHVPLVTQSDVRSVPVPMSLESRQTRDRIPTPQPHRRQTTLPQISVDDNELAFKGGLARTPGSLSQIQAERLRMEDTGRFQAIESDPGRSDRTGQTAALRGTKHTGRVVDASSRFGHSQVRTRVHRRIDHIRPVSYADAEQVAQALNRGVVVVLDLKSTRPDLAKRILDFSFGAASVLEGQVDRFVDRVYIFTRNGPLTEEEQAAIRI